MIADKLTNFRNSCHDCNLKVTPQRLAIYSVLAATTAHPDVETIYQEVAKTMPTISVDTVYRTLEQFSDHNIIMKIEVIHNRARYDANVMRHAHFTCTRCGRIIDVQVREFEKMKLPRIGCGHEVESAHMQLRGICKDCKNSNNL